MSSLPCYPCECQEKVRQDAAEALFGKTEEPEDERHLQGVGKHCEDASADGGVANPESGECVPKYEAAVVPDPEMLNAVLAGHPFGAQQRHEPDQGQETAVRHQPRKAHQHRTQQHQYPHCSVWFTHNAQFRLKPTALLRTPSINYSTGEKSSFPTPQTGHTQSAGMSSKAVPGAIPLSGSPAAGSYSYPQMLQTYFFISG